MSFVDDAREATDEALARLVCTGKLGSSHAWARLIPDATVEAAIAIADSAGICERLDEWRQEDRQRVGRGPGGRPGSLTDRAVLVLLLFLALEDSPLLVSRMAVTISRRLSPKSMGLLGINSAEIKEKGWYDRAWRAIHSLLIVIDPFPAPHNRLLTKAEWADILAARDPEDAARKQVRIDWVANRFVEATLRMVPREIRRRWKGNVCIDATPVPAFGKRGTTKKSDWVGIEPDAAWYVREGDHRDRDDSPDAGGKKGKATEKHIWGWEATFVVMSTNDPSGPDQFPYLVAAMGFGKPGHDVAGHGTRAFSSIVERGHPVGYAIADRAYFPNSVPENLQLPVRALGYDLIFDYREDQLGVTGSHAGAIQVEGAWYCPQMPQLLIDATLDHRVKKSIDEVTWHRRIEERSAYLLRQKEKPDDEGYVPMRCPAVGPSATVVCPLKKAVGSTAGRTRIPVTPSDPDRICTNTSSVSFPPSAGAKFAQALHYGSPTWRQMYSTARNTIEGMNGYLKDASREALDQPGRRRVRGYAAQYLFAAVLVVSANIRKIRAFLEKAAADAAGVVSIARKRRPRRRDRLSDFRPDTGTSATGDPPAA